MPDLTALSALREAATPEPWRECGHDRGGCSCHLIWSLPADCLVAQTLDFNDDVTVGEGLNAETAVLNAQYIVALVNAAPALIAELEAARGVVAAADAVNRALVVKGKAPRLHDAVLARHATEHPTLYRALAKMQSALANHKEATR